jgi:FAD/FMN-containing dehydrogenase
MTEIAGRVLWRGEHGYEEARQSAVWNLLKPERYPDIIVRVAREEDAVAAVRLARERGLRVKARGGGHSWTASHVRDGMLVDFSGFKEIAVDPEARTATPRACGASS